MLSLVFLLVTFLNSCLRLFPKSFQVTLVPSIQIACPPDDFKTLVTSVSSKYGLVGLKVNFRVTAWVYSSLDSLGMTVTSKRYDRAFSSD